MFYNKTRSAHAIGVWSFFIFTLIFMIVTPLRAETHLDTLRRTFTDLRLGQLMHFNMNTFSLNGNVASSNLDPATYNPTALNPAQWISAAKAAGIKFIIVTSKHHDGFAIWDTKVSNPGATYNPYGCMNSRVSSNARKDVIALFTQACRDSGLVPGIYFSVQDRTYGGALNINNTNVLGSSGVTNGRVDRAAISFAFTQIRELVSNYGFIPLLVDDGWSWSMGHTIVPYQEFQDTLRKYSPNTLFTCLNGLFYPWQNDVIFLENSKGVWPLANNTYSSWISNKLGTNWFWQSADAGRSPGTSVSSFISTYLNRCDPLWTNVAPNLSPNQTGQIQAEYVTWMKQLGQSWTPPARAALPTQAPHMDWVVTPVSATATSNSANAKFVMDGVFDGGFADHYEQYLWSSSGSLPQSVTVDLSAIYNDVEMCAYMPKQIAREDASGFDSSAIITGYTISYGTDGSSFTPVSLLNGYNGKWASDNSWKHALFSPVRARYMKLEATSVRSGSVATISELDFGGYTRKPYTGTVQTIGERRNINSLTSVSGQTVLNTYINGSNLSVQKGLYGDRQNNTKLFVGLDGRKIGYGRVAALSGCLLPIGSKAFVARVNGVTFPCHGKDATAKEK